jgi:hypothetical protein
MSGDWISIGTPPPLGRHLAATVRTGRYCAYIRDPRTPITWDR